MIRWNINRNETSATRRENGNEEDVLIDDIRTDEIDDAVSELQMLMNDAQEIINELRSRQGASK